MSTKIIEADVDVAAQAAKLVAEHSAENVVTLSGGRGLQFAVTVESEPEPTPEPKAAQPKKAAPKTAATPAAPES